MCNVLMSDSVSSVLVALSHGYLFVVHTNIVRYIERPPPSMIRRIKIDHPVFP